MGNRRARILIIDDEEDLRVVLQKVLGLEHTVLAAPSGRAAQEILAQNRDFDLILCDLMMPDFSGVNLHAWLKTLDPALADKVIFISGGATEAIADYLSRLPNQRLEKPFDLGDLQALVTTRLAEK